MGNWTVFAVYEALSAHDVFLPNSVYCVYSDHHCIFRACILETIEKINIVIIEHAQ